MPYADPERHREYQRRYQKEWRKRTRLHERRLEADPDYWRKRSKAIRLGRYGLTQEAFDILLAKQGGKCAICQTTEPQTGGYKQDWSIDHCHTTGRVRGLLCHHCNCALGHVRDDPTVLRRMIDYLTSEG